MMAETKRFVVLGLGMFGSTLAKRLSQNGCRVTGVDIAEERVDSLKDVLYEAVIADATERASLEQLSLSSADAIVISLGDTIVPSLLATLHAKELGAGRLIVKGLDEDHAKLLTYLDVDRVIFPKIDVARELADRLTWPNVVDFIPIDPDYSLVEITVPQSWQGRTLADVDLRQQFDVSIVGVKDADSNNVSVFPDGTFVLSENQLLLVVGRQDDLNRLRDIK
jgi:trk system potassium uptake protein TrkA